MSILFTGPSSKAITKPKIWPLFLPFAGCPRRCIFCAQDAQTGIQSSTSLASLLATTWQQISDIQSSLAEPKPFELAFYGGTFTCLPKADQEACMALMKGLRERNWIVSVRCSTRPDACNEEQLGYLTEHGINHIELGVQSFNDEALETAQRGYTGAIAKNACKAVVDAGFTLGIQLLPGMPGVDPSCFLEDVTTALHFLPKGMRFYPCLVINNTPLATLWREGLYAPWSEEITITTLATALIAAWRLQVPVIRLSLAYEPSLEASILAGPRHPALGSMIMAEALIQQAEEAVRTHQVKPKYLYLPYTCKGFWKGHAKKIMPRWEKIGIIKAIWHEESHGMLEFSQSI